MHFKKIHLYLLLLLPLTACSDEPQYPYTPEGADEPDCRTSIITQNKYYEDSNGDKYLWAGDDPTTHFLINRWRLDVCKLKYGLGREHFPALIEPLYDPLADVVDNFGDLEKVVLLRHNTGVKIYPYSVLVKHELINDVVDGQPVMVVYCFLADLAAVYTRRYCGKTLTFGVSGYTYCDQDISNGLESFVLWDRNTESLWWPIDGKGASGPFKGEEMLLHNQQKWEILRWEEIKSLYPNAQVLRDGQEMEPPVDWPILDNSTLNCF